MFSPPWPAAASPPDLDTQLEDILHTVWLAEADWRLNDRIDLAVRAGSGSPDQQP